MQARRVIWYITRSDVSWYSRSANAFQKPWMLSQSFDLTVIQPTGARLPADIAQGCRLERIPCGDVSKRWTLGQMFRFVVGCASRLSKLILGGRASSDSCCTRSAGPIVATGFDVPCLLLGWWLRRRWGLKWFVFCWDPPALSWRDRKDIAGRWVVACVDLIFRRTVRHADRLVLNIHPGVLDEIGFVPSEAQLIRTFNGFVPRLDCETAGCESGDPWLIGVMSNATRAKGFNLVLDAFASLASDFPRLRVVWIGDVAADVCTELSNKLSHEGIPSERFLVMGRLAQQDALRRLAGCGILIHPYLAVPSLKWNYPLKVVEYMSLGRAIVAADLPGVRAYITPDENGLLFAAGVTDELTKTLRRIVGDAREQARLGCQARHVARKFEWPNLNQELAVKLHEGCSHGSGENTLL